MMFKDPLGTTAESLIAQSGARDLRVGDASVYAPHANYVVAGPHCSSDDVRRSWKRSAHESARSSGSN
jgi:UDP-N-acetylenolpyruvoylglucosamine reductase